MLYESPSDLFITAQLSLDSLQAMKDFLVNGSSFPLSTESQKFIEALCMLHLAKHNYTVCFTKASTKLQRKMSGPLAALLLGPTVIFPFDIERMQSDTDEIDPKTWDTMYSEAQRYLRACTNQLEELSRQEIEDQVSLRAKVLYNFLRAGRPSDDSAV